MGIRGEGAWAILGPIFYLFGAHWGPFGAHFIWGPFGPYFGPFGGLLVEILHKDAYEKPQSNTSQTCLPVPVYVAMRNMGQIPANCANSNCLGLILGPFSFGPCGPIWGPRIENIGQPCIGVPAATALRGAIAIEPLGPLRGSMLRFIWSSQRKDLWISLFHRQQCCAACLP